MKINEKSYILILCMVICFGLTSCKKDEPVSVLQNSYSIANETNENAQNSNLSADNPDDNTKIIDDTDIEEEKTVIINVENFGRTNPFVPYTEKSLVASRKANEPLIDPLISGLPTPPTAMDEDPSIAALLQAKVAGILYDGAKSSAIINVLGSDHLVRTGDTILEFYIQAISKNTVAIKSGNNVHDVKVGEIVEGTLNNNNIYNINNKFGGQKKRVLTTLTTNNLNIQQKQDEIEIKTVNKEDL